MGVELALTLREEQRLRMFENKVLRNIFGLREMKLSEKGDSYIMLNYIIIFYSLPNIIRNLKSRRLKMGRI